MFVCMTNVVKFIVTLAAILSKKFSATHESSFGPNKGSLFVYIKNSLKIEGPNESPDANTSLQK